MGKAKKTTKRAALARLAKARRAADQQLVVENELDGVKDAIGEAANKMTFEQYVEFITELDEHVSNCAGSAIDPAHVFHRLKGE